MFLPQSTGFWVSLKSSFDGEHIQSIDLLSDSSKNFGKYCIKGIKADTKRIKNLLDNSLMVVTALAPKIGYDNAAKIAKAAHKNGTTLKEEVLKTGALIFDRLILSHSFD